MITAPEYDRRHELRDEKVETAIRVLRQGRRLTVLELAGRLECTERTAYRVLQAVEERGFTLARTGGNARGGQPIRYFLDEAPAR